MRSILKSKKRQDVDAIVYNRQAEKYLQVQRKASCRYVGPQKSICNSEYLGSADTTVAKKSSVTVNIKVLQIHHKARKDYALQRIGVGLARRS